MNLTEFIGNLSDLNRSRWVDPLLYFKYCHLSHILQSEPNRPNNLSLFSLLMQAIFFFNFNFLHVSAIFPIQYINIYRKFEFAVRI